MASAEYNMTSTRFVKGHRPNLSERDALAAVSRGKDGVMGRLKRSIKGHRPVSPERMGELVVL